jgi:hypothetical protein
VRHCIQSLLIKLRELWPRERAVGALLVAINLLVLANALLHDPRVGYDSGNHLANAIAMSQGKLPTPEDSPEFFSPPLPNLVPAMLSVSGNNLPRIYKLGIGAKTGQLINVLLSVGLTLLLVMICELIRPGRTSLKIGTLLLLGIMPVYYKTFSQYRPEPWVIFLFALAAYIALKTLVVAPTTRRSLLLGVILGLLVLTRQWGFFIFPGVMLLGLARIRKDGWLPVLKRMALILSVSFLVGGWFYIHLQIRYGTVLAFNRDPAASFSLANQSTDFYLNPALDQLFSEPTRPNFPNQVIPVFYSEIWGDYWCYFLAQRDNPAPMNRFLGRMNLAGLLPTALLLAGLVLGVSSLWQALVWAARNREPTTLAHAAPAFFFLIAIVSWLGYMWFLIKYPVARGDTIKATYLLYVFPFICVLSAELLDRIGERFGNRWWQVAIAVLAGIGLHNLPAMITRFYLPVDFVTSIL